MKAEEAYGRPGKSRKPKHSAKIFSAGSKDAKSLFMLKQKSRLRASSGIFTSSEFYLLVVCDKFTS